MFKTISIALSLLTVGIASADSNFQAGQYEFVKMAVTPDNRVEGYYHEVMGEGVTRTCTFFFEGTIVPDGSTYVKTWSDTSKIDGVIDNQPDSLFMEVSDDHPGCSSVGASQAKYGLNFSLLEKKPWIGLGIITENKVYLNKTPIAGTESKVYIVKDDVFSVVEVKDGYTSIEYINDDNKSFTGWIKNSSYSSIKPTEKKVD
jgi:hypothetical protein